jgi:glutathione S-transferase
MRLYHRPGSRSTRVLWLLEEAGLPYELELVDREQAASPEHRARHPLGRVPVLEDDDGTMLFESAALCLYLADRSPSAALIGPPGSRQRALAYQWTLFAMTEIEPPLVAVIRARQSDPALADASAQAAREAAAVLDPLLAEQEWLVGARFGVADVVAGSTLFFARNLSLLEDMQSLCAYLSRLEARPARQRAFGAG